MSARVRPATEDDVPALARLLVDVVAGGASVGPLAGCTPEEAEAFWRRHLAAAQVLVVDGPSGLAGTVSLVLAAPANGAHRAEVAKLLVAPSARRQGLGRRLLQAVEERAAAQGRWLLLLDTTTGSPAQRLYEEAGWTVVGVVEDYAAMPDGALAPTTVLTRRLRA